MQEMQEMLFQPLGQKDPLEKETAIHSSILAWQIQSLGGDDPLKKGMATHPSILAWRIARAEEPDGLQSMGSQRVRHDWARMYRHSR